MPDPDEIQTPLPHWQYIPVDLPLPHADQIRQLILEDLAADGPIAQAVLQLVVKDITRFSRLRAAVIKYTR